jgi:L-ascorbate metabolism protein UlaG (beta-lactamase superfamily)
MTATLTLPAASTAAVDPAGSLTFIGNATVLVRFGGITFLTDPTFVHMHEKVSIGYGMHSTRLTDPAMDVADLPPLDFILLPHFHGDHFDQVAERDLDKSVPIVTTGHAARELEPRGFRNTHPLKTWESIHVVRGDTRLRITAAPGRHGPPMSELVLPDVMGSLIEMQAAGGTPYRMYITGDTLMIDDLAEIPRRFPGLDLALLHLGGTRVLGIMVTMDGAQGVQCLQLVNPKAAIPIHYDDYDVFRSPLSDFQERVRDAGWEDRVHYLNRGDTYRFVRTKAATAA